jgi:hypothetical protein
LRLLIAQHDRLDLHDLQQFRNGVGRAPLLPESQQAADKDNRKDNQRVRGVVQEERQTSRKEQDEHDGTFELREEKRESMRLFALAKPIGSHTLQPPSGFVAG